MSIDRRDLVVRCGLIALLLGADLLFLRSLLETAITSAACMERAKFELILCVAPPDAWLIAVVGATAIALAVLLGAELAALRGPRS